MISVHKVAYMTCFDIVQYLRNSNWNAILKKLNLNEKGFQWSHI